MVKRNKVLYCHTKPDGEVFYVGAGNLSRAYSKTGRSKCWYEIIDKFGYNVEIIKSNLTKEEAKSSEIELINYYGRIINNTGILINKSNGGGGVSEKAFTKEHSENLSNAQRGIKNHRYGKTGINNGKKGGTHPAAKQIIDTVTGKIWNCGQDCSKELKIPYDSLIKALNGNRKNTTNLKYLKEIKNGTINNASSNITTRI